MRKKNSLEIYARHTSLNPLKSQGYVLNLTVQENRLYESIFPFIRLNPIRNPRTGPESFLRFQERVQRCGRTLNIRRQSDVAFDEVGRVNIWLGGGKRPTIWWARCFARTKNPITDQIAKDHCWFRVSQKAFLNLLTTTA